MDRNPRDNHWYRMLVGDVLKLISILIIIDYRFVALPEIRNKQKQNPSMVVLKNSLPKSDGLGYSEQYAFQAWASVGGSCCALVWFCLVASFMT